jgi:hypothetical protein
MQQALHIFKKDVRYLYREAISLVILVLLFPALQSRYIFGFDFSLGLELLIALAASYVIACLIHAEAIPGSNQFWITRPYRWRSLLAAKVLFVLLFVNLPILLIQIIVLHAEKFPVASNWRGFLWCQVLMIVGVELPVAALAAMTRNIVTFAASILVLALIIVGPAAIWNSHQFSDSLDWMRSYIALAGAALITIPAVYWQYRNRRTAQARTWSIAVACVAMAATVLTPWSALFATQARLSKTAVDLHVARDPGEKTYLFSEGQELFLVLPVQISELAPGLSREFEDFIITLRTPDGRKMDLREGQMLADNRNGYHVTIRGHAAMDPSFFESERNQPLTLQASFYFTVFGNSHSQSMLAPDVPTMISDGLQCTTNTIDDLVFRAAFRLPAKSIDVTTTPRLGSGYTERTRAPVIHSISYSPFPATLRINPVAASAPYFLVPGNPVANIVVTEPIAHVRRDLEIADLHITEH